MKVSGIDTIRIEEFPNLLFVEIKTDEGIVGLGETFYGPLSSEAHIHEIIAPYLIGKNPLNIEKHQKNLIGYTLVVTKSTVPVGTGNEIKNIEAISNPEILKNFENIKELKD